MSREFELEPLTVDVGSLVQRTVASLYSHLVTRPTGRAVRMAIEAQLSRGGRPTLSLIDLSQVRVLDFSCADEVVAKLVRHHGSPESGTGAFFVFRGVQDTHLDPIEAVLQRHSLAAVVETGGDRFRLLGSPSEREVRVWRRVEEVGGLAPETIPELFPGEEERRVLARLGRRRLVFPLPGGGYRALSTLVRDLV